MKHFLTVVGIVMMLSLSCLSRSEANTAQRNAVLLQVIDQLNAIKPLLAKAATAQTPDAAKRVHFYHWCEANGKCHSGVQEDIQAIIAGLTQAISATPSSPRKIVPMTGDFLQQGGE